MKLFAAIPTRSSRGSGRTKSARARGRLTVFFGAAPGVGKTFAMLEAARAEKALERDVVVVGIVETHGRPETTALLAGLEVLPRRNVEHRGAVAGRVRSRRRAHASPGIAPGRRDGPHQRAGIAAHEAVAGHRRAADRIGIDVYTTLNVQHLESLNDVVAQITGVRRPGDGARLGARPRRRRASRRPPRRRAARAAAGGKVYVPDQAGARRWKLLSQGKPHRAPRARAAPHRRARRGRRPGLPQRPLDRSHLEDGVGAPVLHRPGASAEHVVRSAALLAQQLAVGLARGLRRDARACSACPRRRRERILRRRSNSPRSSGRRPRSSLAGQVADDRSSSYAREHNLSKLVMGHNRASLWRPAGTLAQQLGRLAARRRPDRDRRAGRPHWTSRAGGRRRAAEGRRASAGAGRLSRGVAGLRAQALRSSSRSRAFSPRPTSSCCTCLPSSASRCAMGAGPAAFAAFVNVLAFDYFFVPPTLSFAVADLQYVITFAVMLAVGLVVGQLTAGLRYQARIAMHRERRSHSLFEVARALSAELVVEQVVETASKAIAREFHAHVRIYVLADDDRLTADAIGRRIAGPRPGDRALGIRSSARSRTRHRHDSRKLLALSAAERLDANARGSRPPAGEPASLRRSRTAPPARDIRGAHGNRARAGSLRRCRPEGDGADRIGTAAQLAAVGVVPRSAHPARRPERPGREPADDRPEPQRRPTRHRRRRWSNQCHAHVAPRSTTCWRWLGSRAASSVCRRFGTRSRKSSAAPCACRSVSWLRAPSGRTCRTGLPLVKCDAVLIERVLVNLLENAAKYTPPDAIVERPRGKRRGEEMRVTVADNGPGIRPGTEQEIFNKFSRGVRESAIGGVGLGLAICKAIVEAHGGSISVANRGELGPLSPSRSR